MVITFAKAQEDRDRKKSERTMKNYPALGQKPRGDGMDPDKKDDGLVGN